VKIVSDVRKLADTYVAKGGKMNRRKQRSRMLSFAKHCAGMGESQLGQLGERHVIEYWRENRELSDAVLYQHWLAIRELWQMIRKPKDPPRPRKHTETKQN
jgi:hypothetical protein